MYWLINILKESEQESRICFTHSVTGSKVTRPGEGSVTRFITATRPSGEQAGAQSRAERSGCHHIRTAELTVWDRVLEETEIQYWERSGITSFILSGCSCKDCSKRSSFIWNVCANNDDVTTCHLRSIRPGSTHVQCKTPHILWWESGCCREEGGSWTVILKTVCSLLYIWLRERQVKRSNIHMCVMSHLVLSNCLDVGPR